MENNIDKILNERGEKYGPFNGHAFITQKLKKVMQESPKWNQLTHSQKESLEMISHKIGRILNGDPNYDDNWIDIEGYANLVTKEIHEKQSTQRATNTLFNVNHKTGEYEYEV